LLSRKTVAGGWKSKAHTEIAGWVNKKLPLIGDERESLAVELA